MIKRGEIYLVDFGQLTGNGSVQQGIRPAMILQNDVGNRYSPVTIVAPITTKSKRNIPTHVDLLDVSGLEANSRVMLEQIITINKDQLLYDEPLARVHPEEMTEINHAILISLGVVR